jgi:hypothetical protein
MFVSLVGMAGHIVAIAAAGQLKEKFTTKLKHGIARQKKEKLPMQKMNEDKD